MVSSGGGHCEVRGHLARTSGSRLTRAALSVVPASARAALGRGGICGRGGGRYPSVRHRWPHWQLQVPRAASLAIPGAHARNCALQSTRELVALARTYWGMGPKRPAAASASSEPAETRAKRQRRSVAPASASPALRPLEDAAEPIATVAAIADTHGVLDDDLLLQLRDLGTVDHLLHMGDIGDTQKKSRLPGLALLQRLREFAGGSTPVTAVAGNVDEPDKALMMTLPYSTLVDLAGWRLLLVHGHMDGLKISAHGVMDKGLAALARRDRADIVLFGHSHKPLVARQEADGMPLPIAPDQTTWSVRHGSGSSHDGLLLVNPGSAGPRRFKLPRCWFVLRLYKWSIEIERRDIGVDE